ncbi:type II toxin-antitoxin system VapC family toxin [Massilia sp. YIM B04103]|uniref:type II toxin-antitoxin system VapC family toxin n=1 Tax=Massilia sp. YIM B04103 TaxID=2963106 RepID=UPI00210A3348|nr:VapC toxin family PIN domain ribonuclease [Massilia sp. YIM B04103]
MSGILVDTSIWVDHFRRRNDILINLLESDLVLTHPMIVGEIACGTLPTRTQTLRDLDLLQQAQRASFHEVQVFIEREKLYGLGCGLVDLFLLMSTLLTPGVQLWTLDKRLTIQAKRFQVLYRPV